jgi:hypothetical protein
MIFNDDSLFWKCLHLQYAKILLTAFKYPSLGAMLNLLVADVADVADVA